nr:MAG TPA: hypothetical protein [Caudoviricetes sp.]
MRQYFSTLFLCFFMYNNVEILILLCFNSIFLGFYLLF